MHLFLVILCVYFPERGKTIDSGENTLRYKIILQLKFNLVALRERIRPYLWGEFALWCRYPHFTYLYKYQEPRVSPPPSLTISWCETLCKVPSEEIVTFYWIWTPPAILGSWGPSTNTGWGVSCPTSRDQREAEQGGPGLLASWPPGWFHQAQRPHQLRSISISSTSVLKWEELCIWYM